MSTSSSEEGSRIASHHATSSGLESTGFLLSSVPPDSSDVQTEITPPTSPTPSESKMRTPRDILDASRRLGKISLQGDETPTKPKRPKQVLHRVPPASVAGDEAGYDADGDGDGDEGILRTSGAGTTAARPIRRPTFLRIDTRQHRRVASMLAIRRSSPNFVDGTDVLQCSPRVNLKFGALFPAVRTNQKFVNAECYELRRRQRADPDASPGLVGLGIGYPENHPMRNRALSMPLSVLAAVSPSKTSPSPGGQQQVHRRCECWSPSPPLSGSESKSGSGSQQAAADPGGKQCNSTQKPVRVDTMNVCAPSPVRLVSRLRPTFLEVSPSPIELLSGTSADCYNPDGVLAGNRIRSTMSRLKIEEGQRDGNCGRNVTMGSVVG